MEIQIKVYFRISCLKFIVNWHRVSYCAAEANYPVALGPGHKLFTLGSASAFS